MVKTTYAALIAVIVLVGFFILSNIILVFTATTSSLFLAFGIPVFVGATTSMGFFYVFTHEETFPFATVIEKRQKEAEKRWLKVLPHAGKLASVIMLGVVGGPLLAAFSAQFLIPHYERRYEVLALVGALSGILIAAVARGLFGGIASLLELFSA
ncbi:hypothetical protein A2801_03335 [Candidatus Woesebacteria bacterium RIFCSPHIGHO2_01_FULL_41_10]|uniref:Uncharacterized protein n=1 Tax=Candidatus Woesebacteria bacterium RIFCSPHIGHO2_01_FULL_41_10 TaxID=1802500 RepID=A0A1F7YT11_9BACT|nr:MAG: hypothetical protein A2801_03335 [Candidatus Woesebacteria bacterium RIFCSPHIGHO2_01_FULL_41_10]